MSLLFNLFSIRAAVPNQRSQYAARGAGAAAALIAVVYLLVVFSPTGSPVPGADSIVEWTATFVRTLTMLAVGLWMAYRPPFAPVTDVAERQGPIIMGLALLLASVWFLVSWLNPLLYTSFSMAWWYVIMVGSFLQASWLARRGITGFAALYLMLNLGSYILSSVGSQNVGNEFANVLLVLIASLLVRWWAGFVVAVVMPTIAELIMLARLVDQPPTLIGWVFYLVMLTMIAAVAGTYARSLERALQTAEQRTEEAQAAQATLNKQHQLLQQQATELAEQRSRLADDVAERTAELQHALDELKQSAVAIRELQTPIVPILDGVLVIPLIGAFDSTRAQQFVADLLKGIEQRRCTTVVLDVTGLPVIDRDAARMLLDASSAAQLLGARVTLVGIAPEIAQTLISLGVDLHSLTTARDLQRVVESLIAKRTA